MSQNDQPPPPDATVEIPREALLQTPSPADIAPSAAAAPPPPPPPPRHVNDPRSGLGWIWVGVVVVVVGLFVVAAYFIVARAEEDRPTGEGGPAPTEPGGDTAATESTTTTTAPPTTAVPGELTIVVLNGTTQIGWAGENVTRLADAGYTAASAADAAAEGETTTIFVAEGREADGAAVAAAIGLPEAPVQPKGESVAKDGSADAEAQVVVVLGADSVG